jgi:CDK-activating kinase assembly factor MAT1
MCSNCVNRIFNEGPNQCPYAGCHKTLRRRGFRSAYFGDLAVEREVDIRKRVATVFNKVEDDFEDLRAYNDYLQQVEDLTFALTSGPEAERRRAEANLQAYEHEHKAEIERNKRRGNQSEDAARRRLLAEQEAALTRRLEAQREDEEERRREVRFREDLLDGLATAEQGHARQTVTRIILKKRGQNRQASTAAAAASFANDRHHGGDHISGVGVGSGSDGVRGVGVTGGGVGVSGQRLSIRGLKVKRRPSDANRPYDPFGGLDVAPSRYRLGDLSTYHSEWVDMARTRDDMRVGGYSADEYVSRAVFEAFAGLAVLIDEELGLADIATAEAAMAARSQPAGRMAAAGRMEVDDSL